MRHILGIVWHVGGMFILPFVLGFAAALFFEVSEVADTLPMLIGLCILLIAPAFVAELRIELVSDDPELDLEALLGADAGVALARDDHPARDLLGLILRVRREWRTLAERDRFSTEEALASLHRHARIVTPRGWAILTAGHDTAGVGH